MAESRATKEYLEILAAGGRDHRVTKEYVEVLAGGGRDHRVTKEYIEVLVEVVLPEARLSGNATIDATPSGYICHDLFSTDEALSAHTSDCAGAWSVTGNDYLTITSGKVGL